MKKIKSIDLVFENCESAVVPIDAIYFFAISDVRKQYSICNVDEIHEYNYGKYFGMVFHDLKSLEYDAWSSGEKRSLYKRITDHMDITSVDIMYEDGTHDYIGVPWRTIRSTFRNFFQVVKIIKYPNGEKCYKLEIHEGWSLRKIINFLNWKLIKIPYYGLTYNYRTRKWRKKQK